MEDLEYSLATDLVTGGGLTVLLSVAKRKPGVGLALAGALLGLALSCLGRLRNSLKCARSVFALVLSARQFFSMSDAIDSDVGAGLVAIPFSFVTCCMPHSNLSEYFRHARLVSSAFNAAVLVAAGFYYSTSPGNAGIKPGPATSIDADGTGGLGQVLVVLDFAYATSQPPWESSHPVLVAGARGAVFVLLSVASDVCRGLIAGEAPVWLQLVYSAALVNSAQVHASHVRIQLSVDDPQRALMLLVVAALSVGYSEINGDPSSASFAALSVLGVSLVWWVRGAKFIQRSE